MIIFCAMSFYYSVGVGDGDVFAVGDTVAVGDADTVGEVVGEAEIDFVGVGVAVTDVSPDSLVVVQ